MTQLEALNVLKTGANVFLTGEPGSGKTYVVNQYVKYLRERKIEPAITASTGIAATHIGGYTIHSWSGIGIKNTLTKYDLDKIAQSEYLTRRIRKAKVLIIDEISMLRAETLSMIDAVCREVRQSSEAFGNLQVVLVGDFFQLPPINKEKQENIQVSLLSEKEANFAYESGAWKNIKPITCYLSEQHRQDDGQFLDLLCAIRRDTVNQDHLDCLRSRFVETGQENITKLYSHNADVDRVNLEMLEKIGEETVNFEMTSAGAPGLVAGLKKGCLSPESLALKKRAVVMCTKNNPKEGFVNGTLGVVADFDGYTKYPIVKTYSGQTIKISPMDWSIEEQGKIKAKISQVPLRLAWAMTVHKSQGMSLDSAVMDLSGVFEYGQGYVALSRVCRLSGLHLLGLNDRALKVHPQIFEQDNVFKNASEETRKTFGELPAEEMKKMHRNFISALGGKWKEKEVPMPGGVGIPTSPQKENVGKKPKSNYLEKIREKHKNAYARWRKEEEKDLVQNFNEGKTIKEISILLGRKTGGIRARLVKLGLLEEN
ncbi:hypothetical protein A3A09_01750 [Candidatus Nomurabacteria bacterium RIFCSPLOWO2_01_FULL_42_20]|nr:MAG: hypothetical protein A3A09_01750 [Candidatus Nomurabacteria bacterium RIFCSPLOWO2_01_FULL_42_20]